MVSEDYRSTELPAAKWPLMGSSIPLMFSSDQLLRDTAATAPQSIADVFENVRGD